MEPPVDRPAKLSQRVVHVDDLIEPRPEEIVCPLSRRSLGRIESPSAEPTEAGNHSQTLHSILQGNKPTAAAFLQMQ